MKLPIKNTDGQDSGKQAELTDNIFAIEPHDHLIYMEVKRHLAARRQGTHKAKERGEITGSTTKLRRQKGTGMARVGDIKNPIFRGGGRTFGPKPRDYNFKLNKKEKALARKSALSQKVRDEGIMVVEDLSFDEPYTKKFAEIQQNLGVQDSKVVWVTGEKDDNLLLSGRNIPGVKFRAGHQLTTYEALNNNYLIFTESGLQALTENLSGKKS